MTGKIYTKAGDQGKTRLLSGSCVQKNSLRVECYGQTDELCSLLGVVAEISKKDLPSIHPWIFSLQNQLFALGSHLACDKENKNLPHFYPNWIDDLEKQMDAWDEKLAPLKNFILPGGSLLSAHLQVARSVCRRAERSVTKLKTFAEENKEYFPKLSVIYLNRLSDALFMAARWVNLEQNVSDTIWKP